MSQEKGFIILESVRLRLRCQRAADIEVLVDLWAALATGRGAPRSN